MIFKCKSLEKIIDNDIYFYIIINKYLKLYDNISNILHIRIKYNNG